MENRDLYNGLVNGDKIVIDKIYKLYHKKIFNFAVSFLKDEDVALDVVQETFIKLWEQRKSLKKDTNIESYIFTVTKNAVLSIFRKYSTEQKYLDYLRYKIVSNTSGSEEVTSFDFLQEHYDSLLQQLPAKRREVFELSRKKGLSNKEIAKLKGISIKTVENQMTKSLAFLKENMDMYGAFWALFYYMFID